MSLELSGLRTSFGLMTPSIMMRPTRRSPGAGPGNQQRLGGEGQLGERGVLSRGGFPDRRTVGYALFDLRETHREQIAILLARLVAFLLRPRGVKDRQRLPEQRHREPESAGIRVDRQRPALGDYLSGVEEPKEQG